jgi:hypothetical protein
MNSMWRGGYSSPTHLTIAQKEKRAWFNIEPCLSLPFLQLGSCALGAQKDGRGKGHGPCVTDDLTWEIILRTGGRRNTSVCMLGIGSDWHVCVPVLRKLSLYIALLTPCMLHMAHTLPRSSHAVQSTLLETHRLTD